MHFPFIFLSVFPLLSFCFCQNACKQKTFPTGIVCECNSGYCDTIDPVGTVAPEDVVVYTSTKAGDRMVRTVAKWQNFSYAPEGTIQIGVNSNKVYQKILGFGGAFTDSASINFFQLSQKSQNYLLRSYFDSELGIGYTVGRVPIASCDFSTHIYSYDDVSGDFNLSQFSLAEEDIKFKIPFILRANNFTNLKLFGSPWSAPGWMKNTGNMVGRGYLKGSAGNKYHKTWANYFVKFLDSYKKNNVSFWGLTVQNEPSTGFIPLYPFQTMGFTPESERDFIKTDLGPALNSASYGNVKLMILDDSRPFLTLYSRTILSDPDTAKYVSGIGLHWYWNWLSPASHMTEVHNEFPDKFILPTEACNGASDSEQSVILGSWKRAESYAKDIIEDLNNWAVGWTDWNLCLDTLGGPNWVNNTADAPIIIDSKNDVFYKQPMFYAMGHFSKFMKPGAVRIETLLFSVIGLNENSIGDSFKIVAFKNQKEEQIILVILNMSDSDQDVVIARNSNQHVKFTSKQHSIMSIIWKNLK